MKTIEINKEIPIPMAETPIQMVEILILMVRTQTPMVKKVLILKDRRIKRREVRRKEHKNHIW